eukprot:TRINITY_DN16048_c0_g1_i1.p2 TRINITY_DN16048_c0_g1~~TRINITY_DN16048_c0_g1_i1.p2  ORF type:complete len:163 (-),score=38.04 TRINITY_DN16048_c0_g1_i1:57-545(-)
MPFRYPFFYSNEMPQVIIKNTFVDFAFEEEKQLRRSKSVPATYRFSFTLGKQMPTSGSRLAEGMPEVKVDHLTPASAATTSSVWHKQELHKLGLCHPCSYFAFKGDGCHKGEDCEFCHFCTPEEAKERKKLMKRAARANGKVHETKKRDAHRRRFFAARASS